MNSSSQRTNSTNNTNEMNLIQRVVKALQLKLNQTSGPSIIQIKRNDGTKGSFKKSKVGKDCDEVRFPKRLASSENFDYSTIETDCESKK